MAYTKFMTMHMHLAFPRIIPRIMPPNHTRESYYKSYPWFWSHVLKHPFVLIELASRDDLVQLLSNPASSFCVWHCHQNDLVHKMCTKRGCEHADAPFPCTWWRTTPSRWAPAHCICVPGPRSPRTLHEPAHPADDQARQCWSSRLLRLLAYAVWIACDPIPTGRRL